MNIDFSRIKGSENIDDVYLRKCIRELQKWNTPLDNWECIGIVDIFEDNDTGEFSTCEVCGCSKVRYEHHFDLADQISEVMKS